MRPEFGHLPSDRPRLRRILSAREYGRIDPTHERVRGVLTRLSFRRYLTADEVQQIAFRVAKKHAGDVNTPLRLGIPDGADLYGLWRGEHPFKGHGRDALSYFEKAIDNERRKRRPKPPELIILETQLRFMK